MSTRETPEVREEEILNACEKLYEKMSFSEVTLKEIGKETSFSRPSIYNYFHSKEEIFLGLFEREYILWCEDLKKIADEKHKAEDLPEALARSLEKRGLMLKLLADNIYGNLYETEENSRVERLVSFEKAYGKSVFLIDSIMATAFPDRTDSERNGMRRVLLEFLHGINTYASVTRNQIETMKAAGVIFEKRSVFELAIEGLETILR